MGLGERERAREGEGECGSWRDSEKSCGGERTGGVEASPSDDTRAKHAPRATESDGRHSGCTRRPGEEHEHPSRDTAHRALTPPSGETRGME
ncbi:hypothetical protein E2C01_076819 [Portunus trituberculatus]|uniref:Uncharacterized protein n=1 Tax=Portunus trituberculatus TaxID=210409 RepID=A0A5B7IE68_PORTR|nr:hypothetical protein [Portunus trituberculatus]